ncbi:MAG: VCBS repeat-containing protein, partial [Planctomycetota bacterium]
MARWLPLLLIVFAFPVSAEEPEPWFTNVSKEVGLTDVRAKDGIFTDLNGDGFYDLCLDRRRLYLSEKGKSFAAHEEHGIEFPEVVLVPLKNGKADTDKAKKTTFTPQYLYFADVDNDGDQDALYGVHSNWEYFDQRAMKWVAVTGCDHGVRSTVWLNDGAGKFTRGPESDYSARDGFGPAMALAIVDVDLDGKLDLYEGREYRQYGVLYGCGVDRLWRGDGKGGFSDETEKFGLMTVPEPAGPNSSRPSYGVTHADVDGDGRPDLLQMAYGRQWNYLWLGGEDGKFTEVGRSSGFAGDGITHGRYPRGVRRAPERPFRSNGNTFDCAVGDVDNDGDLDLFLGEIQHAWAGESSDPPSLLINETEDGVVKFRRRPVTEFLPKREFRDARNWNYGDLHAAFADFDLDGRLDLLIGSGDYPDGQYLRLYRQKADGEFEEVTEVAGFDWEGCGDLSIGDFDRDGDPDILAGRSFMRLNKAHRDKHMGGIAVNEVGLFRNDVGNRSGNHWLNVRLVGRLANRS